VSGPTPPDVTVLAARLHYRRPPLGVVVVDLVLGNPASRPRWLLVPDNLSPTDDTTVNGAESWLLAGSGRLPVTHFQGLGGFYALLLPPGATVRVRDLSVDIDTDALADGLALTVTSAAQVRVGDTAVQDWFGAPAACAPGSDASTCGATLVAERWSDDMSELAVTRTDTSTVDVALSAVPA
jgi:hypothetical protein